MVVRDKSDDVIGRIARIALKVNSKHNCSINFYVVNKRNREIVDSS
ncbi:hypothetical protein YN1551_3273 [Sulfolobus islandicus Y.N.15.51]|uniref:Uncharacterized protein n=1 Tax=Saccharolobus islandicus (strain Y.N.15.51 / Yellowstone \|nr:hypothetical protein YN1551_3273 [Sulfolobus islandicus Y.N.15.51]